MTGEPVSRPSPNSALGYAAETALLESNPAGRIRWHAPKVSAAIDPGW